MKKILVTGGDGQLGSELKVLANTEKNYQFFFSDIADLDITDDKAIAATFEKYQPDYVINCAAYTAVDKAETNEALADSINRQAVRYLAATCVVNNCQLIHVSSDYVYHNDINRPLVETDPTSPKGVYAKTKLEGDLQSLEVSPATIILRTSWVYSSFGHNFVKTMLRLGKERDQLGVVYDQIGVPTYAKDIAEAILAIIDKTTQSDATYGGVYHFAPQGVTCWYDFAKAIFEIEGIDCKVNAILSKAYPTPAQRPTYSVLNCDKIKTTFDLKIPYWKDSVKACLAVLKEEEALIV